MEELDIREILHLIQKRIWVIIAIIIFFAVVSGIISTFFLSEIYASSTTLIVSKQNGSSAGNDINLSDINLARNLVDTYSVIIKSNRVLDNVVRDQNLNMSTGALKSKIHVSAEGNTEIIRITVEDTLPERSRDIANSVANVFMVEVIDLLKLDNVQIIDTAEVPGGPVRPNTKKNIAIAAMLGAMVGFGLVLLIEYLDNTIKTREDVEKYLQLPVIGGIPHYDDDSSGKKRTKRTTRLAVSSSVKSSVMEAYRTLRTNIQFSNLDNNLRIIMVTSSQQEEGKSSTAANLAVSIAQSDKRVLLIDCDLRRSSLHKIFHLLNDKGLTNLLVEGTDPHTTIQKVSIPNLHVLTGGPKPPNPSELLGSARIQAFLQQISGHYDMVILDTPPIMPVSDALVLSQYTDGVIYVINHGEVTHEMAVRTKSDLEKINAKILGVVINSIPADVLGKYGSYYYYYEEDESSGNKKKSKRKASQAKGGTYRNG